VAGAFLDIGRAKAAKAPHGQQRFTKVGVIAARYVLSLNVSAALTDSSLAAMMNLEQFQKLISR
jgi:hypothetical protein